MLVVVKVMVMVTMLLPMMNELAGACDGDGAGDGDDADDGDGRDESGDGGGKEPSSGWPVPSPAASSIRPPARVWPFWDFVTSPRP